MDQERIDSLRDVLTRNVAGGESSPSAFLGSYADPNFRPDPDLPNLLGFVAKETGKEFWKRMTDPIRNLMAPLSETPQPITYDEAGNPHWADDPWGEKGLIEGRQLPPTAEDVLFATAQGIGGGYPGGATGAAELGMLRKDAVRGLAVTAKGIMKTADAATDPFVGEETRALVRGTLQQVIPGIRKVGQEWWDNISSASWKFFKDAETHGDIAAETNMSVRFNPYTAAERTVFHEVPGHGGQYAPPEVIKKALVPYKGELVPATEVLDYMTQVSRAWRAKPDYMEKFYGADPTEMHARLVAKDVASGIPIEEAFLTRLPKVVKAFERENPEAMKSYRTPLLERLAEKTELQGNYANEIAGIARLHKSREEFETDLLKKATEGKLFLEPEHHEYLVVKYPKVADEVGAEDLYMDYIANPAFTDNLEWSDIKYAVSDKFQTKADKWFSNIWKRGAQDKVETVGQAVNPLSAGKGEAGGSFAEADSVLKSLKDNAVRASKELNPWAYQNSFPEQIISQSWDKANSPRFVLEGAGDIVREFSKHSGNQDAGYVMEKVGRIQRFLDDSISGKIHPTDSMDAAFRHEPERIAVLKHLYENQPVVTEAQRVAKETVIKLMNRDYLGAQASLDKIKSNAKQWTMGEEAGYSFAKTYPTFETYAARMKEMGIPLETLATEKAKGASRFVNVPASEEEYLARIVRERLGGD
jgi:hypothetical protein